MALKSTSDRIAVGQKNRFAAEDTVGMPILRQYAAISSTVPVTGQRVAVIPTSARIVNFGVELLTALGGEAVLRFSTGSAGGNNLGAISLSAARVYTGFPGVVSGAAIPVSGSSQQIYISVVSASGVLTQAAGQFAFIDYVMDK